jgi:hypothetical protein
MAGNHKRRKRKIDVNKMSVEEAKRLEKQLSDEITKIMDEANTKCNKLLNIYGLQTHIEWGLSPLDEKSTR